MRYGVGLIMAFALLGSASALTPLLDSSPLYFSGEWAGTGAKGAYCYLSLGSDGRGLVLIDAGTGDWLGARIHWRNERQVLIVEKSISLSLAPQLRILPLHIFALSTEFNQSLALNWDKRADGCHLQKIETTKHHLTQARTIIDQLPPPASGR